MERAFHVSFRQMQVGSAGAECRGGGRWFAMRRSGTRTTPLAFVLAILVMLSGGARATDTRELFRDTSFAGGFGASWCYGSKFKISSERKEGAVTAYREIWPWQVHLIPDGSVTNVGIKEHAWDFEEGGHLNYTNARGEFIAELHAKKLVANHVIEVNTPEKLQFAQFNNDGLADTDPQRNTRLVKRITTDRHGKITLAYNSLNEIRNVATGYSAQFALDIWPTLLLVQNFHDLPKLRDFARLDFFLSWQVTKMKQLSDWPAGLPGAAMPDMNLQFYFLLREITHPEHVLWVGLLQHPSNPKHGFIHTSVDQWDSVMHREPFLVNGKTSTVGTCQTYHRELKTLVREALAASAAKQPEKKLSVNADDYYIHLFNIGWEGIGHWESEAELSDLSLKGLCQP